MQFNIYTHKGSVGFVGEARRPLIEMFLRAYITAARESLVELQSEKVPE